MDELRKSRYDVSCLREEITTLQHQLEEKQGNMGKEINRLTQKLKGIGNRKFKGEGENLRDDGWTDGWVRERERERV